MRSWRKPALLDIPPVMWYAPHISITQERARWGFPIRGIYVLRDVLLSGGFEESKTETPPRRLFLTSLLDLWYSSDGNTALACGHFGRPLTLRKEKSFALAVFSVFPMIVDESPSSTPVSIRCTEKGQGRHFGRHFSKSSGFSRSEKAKEKSLVTIAAQDFQLWSCWPDSNWRPHPYQGCALPTELQQQSICPEFRGICGDREGT